MRLIFYWDTQILKGPLNKKKVKLTTGFSADTSDLILVVRSVSNRLSCDVWDGKIDLFIEGTVDNK